MRPPPPPLADRHCDNLDTLTPNGHSLHPPSDTQACYEYGSDDDDDWTSDTGSSRSHAGHHRHLESTDDVVGIQWWIPDDEGYLPPMMHDSAVQQSIPTAHHQPHHGHDLGSPPRLPDDPDYDLSDGDAEAGGAPLHALDQDTDAIVAMLNSNSTESRPPEADDAGTSDFSAATDSSVLPDVASLLSILDDAMAAAEPLAEEWNHPVLPSPSTSDTSQPSMVQPEQLAPFVHIFGNWVDGLHSVQGGDPNPTILGSENPGLLDFLHNWAQHFGYRPSTKGHPPDMAKVLEVSRSGPQEVRYADLAGDACDVQGLDWASMQTTRRAARTWRDRTYCNYVNRRNAQAWITPYPMATLPKGESYFRFKRMNIRQDTYLAHFQLRGIMASPTSTHTFYASPRGITRMNMSSRKTDVAMDLRHFPGYPAVTALDAGHGVVFGGTFNGEYCYKSMYSHDKAFSEGQITNAVSGITNHVKLELSRSSSTPIAAIASNDDGFRVMDTQTGNLINTYTYPFALNCSAMSPDRRLRVMVGDHVNGLITNADTGEILQELTGHLDYGFACDWSDNGWTVATAFQDKGMKIWDARRWCNSRGVSTPVASIVSELAGVRSLRFSPTGSGKPVLVAVEEADYVNIIDAQTFSRKQTIDFFGELGGAAFTNDGQDLNILSCDGHRGGVAQFERCGWATETHPRSRRSERAESSGMLNEPRAWRPHGASLPRANRRFTMLEDMDPF
ncbi:hypothetical protein S40288_05408 [Stachybotrys chartarum IBT 40288]|nr:hypothetical protein S40288_05408 [Stachybotrys chartarum IBT 40288]